MEAHAMTAFSVHETASLSGERHGEIVEIALLLPRKRAEALMALSARQRQSVGQILRGLIDRALVDVE